MAKKKLKFEKEEKIEDTGRIEEIAVGHIVTLINETTEKLKSEIPTNDKGVSFDGSIILTDGEYTKKGYIGKIPVQVKGKQLYKASGFPGYFKYRLDRDHYKNYYNEGGVLLIVVGIIYDPKEKKYQKRIYIDQILRLKARLLIANVPKSQATILTIVREIEDNELEKVCFDFYENFDKQPRMIEVDQLKLPNKGNLTETYISKKQRLLNKEFYISEGKNSTYSGYLTPDKFTIGYKELLVNVSGKEFFLNVLIEGRKTTNSKEEYKIVIEQLIEITMGESGKLKINKIEFNSLEYQLRVLPFLKEVIEKKKLKIENLFDVEFNDLKIIAKEIEQIKNTNVLLKETESFFEKFHIKKDLKIEGKHNDVITTLYDIKEILSGKEYSKLNGFDATFSHMVKINIHNVSFLTFYNKESNSFEYPFNIGIANKSLIITERDNRGEVIKEEFFPNIYITITDFLNVCNIDYQVILNSFQTKESPGEIGHHQLISFILDRIKEYDQTNDMRMLDFCINLCHIFIENLTSTNDSYFIYTINYYQCIKRLRNLTKKEIFNLARLDLPKDTDQNKIASFCVSVLIEDLESAQELLGHISNVDEYPIYTLYNELLKK